LTIAKDEPRKPLLVVAFVLFLENTGFLDHTARVTFRLFARQRATEEDLMNFCKEQLPKYKRPKAIKLMDALPKSAVGKILRRELRKLD